MGNASMGQSNDFFFYFGKLQIAEYLDIDQMSSKTEF